MSIIKSFKNHSRILIGLLVITFLVFVFLIISLIMAQYSIGKMEEDYSSIIKDINRVFLILQNPGEFAEDEVGERLEELQSLHTGTKSAAFSLTKKVLPQEFPEIPENRSVDNYEEFYGNLRDYTAVIRANKFFVINSQVQKIYVILGLLLILIFLIGYMTLHYFRRFYNFFSSVSSGINKIDAHLNYTKTDELKPQAADSLEIRDFYGAINKINRDIYLDQLLDSIETYGRLTEVINAIVPLIEDHIPFDRIALAFADTKGYVTAEAAFTRYKEIYLDPGKSEDISRTSLISLVKSKKPRIIPDLVKYAKGRKISESTKLILKEEILSSLTVPLFTGERCIGFLFFSSRKAHIYKNRHLIRANRIGNKLKNRFYNDFLTQEIIAETSRSFVTLVNEKDNETSTHLERMAQYAFFIARTLSESFEELTPQMIREIRWFAPLHDIGKVGVPDAILGKIGSLDQQESRIMRQHVDLGEKILRSMNGNLGSLLNSTLLDTAVDIIRGHHEKFDGSGYPHGLKGEEIPLAGRIVAVADVFDALTSKRVYKPAYSIEESLRIMKEDMAGSFDITILEGLERSLNDIRVVYNTLGEV